MKKNSEKETIAKVASLSGIWYFVGYALNAISSFIIAKLIGAEALGAVSVGVSILLIFQLIGICGMDRGVVKFTSKLIGSESYRITNRPLISALKISIPLSLLIIFIYNWAIQDYINILFPRIQDIQYIMSNFIYLCPVVISSAYFGSFLQGSQSVQHVHFSNNILKPLCRLTIVLLLFFWTTKAIALVYGTIISFIAQFLYLNYCRMKKWSELKTRQSRQISPNIDNEHWSLSSFLSFSLPLTIITVLNLATQQFDILIVGHYLNSLETGVYTMIQRIGNLVPIPLMVVATILAPTVSKLLSQNDLDGIQDVYQFSSKWITIFSGALFILLFSGTMDILSILGKDFLIGNTALMIFSFGQMINAFLGPSGVVLVMLERPKLVIFNSVISSILGVSLSITLIPNYGIVGASIAMSTAIISVSMISLYQLKRYCNILPYSAITFFKRICGIILTISVNLMVLQVLPDNFTILRLTTVILVSLPVWFGYMFLSEGVTKSEKNILRRMVQRKAQLV